LTCSELAFWRAKGEQFRLVNYGEIIADNLSNVGWSWGCVSAIDCSGRTIWIADAHRGDGKRYVVRADDRLTEFLELESTIRRLKANYGSRKSVGRRLID
jgi:hypothetical protein